MRSSTVGKDVRRGREQGVERHDADVEQPLPLSRPLARPRSGRGWASCRHAIDYVYVYRSALVAGLVPAAVVTEILTWPATCAGEVAMIDVLEETVYDAVVVPNLTFCTVTNPAPVMVTLVPPDVGPLVRERELMTGP